MTWLANYALSGWYACGTFCEHGLKPGSWPKWCPQPLDPRGRSLWASPTCHALGQSQGSPHSPLNGAHTGHPRVLRGPGCRHHQPHSAPWIGCGQQQVRRVVFPEAPPLQLWAHMSVQPPRLSPACVLPPSMCSSQCSPLVMLDSPRDPGPHRARRDCRGSASVALVAVPGPLESVQHPDVARGGLTAAVVQERPVLPSGKRLGAVGGGNCAPSPSASNTEAGHKSGYPGSSLVSPGIGRSECRSVGSGAGSTVGKTGLRREGMGAEEGEVLRRLQTAAVTLSKGHEVAVWPRAPGLPPVRLSLFSRFTDGASPTVPKHSRLGGVRPTRIGR